MTLVIRVEVFPILGATACKTFLKKHSETLLADASLPIAELLTPCESDRGHS